MIIKPISIFNEILGPIMRGPSSSHTAGAYRIGQMSIQILGRKLKKVILTFSKRSSLSTTYVSHGAEAGLLAGLLGIPMESDDIKDVVKIFHKKGLKEEVIINDNKCRHPNTYNLELIADDGYSVKIVGISTGGGMSKIVNINGKDVNIEGDTCETIEGIGTIKPVLPVLFSPHDLLPFIDVTGFERYVDNKKELWEYALEYESIRGGISKEEVWNIASKVLSAMKQSLKTGLSGTNYKDRILNQQFHLIDEARLKNKLIPSPLINQIEKYVLAIMECKSSFGLIVAAPTAGACAVLPSAIFACDNEYGFDMNASIKALLAAGLIGMFIAKGATISAEVGGCQAECGAASGMAAAAVVQLMGGNAKDCLHASSFALQNILGMICDPVGMRVEVPCLGKNIMCSLNAISAANIALAGVNTLIPLSEVISAMDKVGKSISYKLRCTGLGGLSVSKTSLEIEKKLSNIM